VLRLLRALGPIARLAFEVAALEAARSAGVPVPQIYEEVVVDGRPGLVMEHLQGPDLLTTIGQKPIPSYLFHLSLKSVKQPLTTLRSALRLPAIITIFFVRPSWLPLSHFGNGKSLND
jgi:hypothetical protein